LAAGAWWQGCGRRAVDFKFLPSGKGVAPGDFGCCGIVDAWISGLEGLSSLTFMLGLDGLSPIGVWDVLGGGTHDGHGFG